MPNVAAVPGGAALLGLLDQMAQRCGCRGLHQASGVSLHSRGALQGGSALKRLQALRLLRALLSTLLLLLLSPLQQRAAPLLQAPPVLPWRHLGALAAAAPSPLPLTTAGVTLRCGQLLLFRLLLAALLQLLPVLLLALLQGVKLPLPLICFLFTSPGRLLGLQHSLGSLPRLQGCTLPRCLRSRSLGQIPFAAGCPAAAAWRPCWVWQRRRCCSPPLRPPALHCQALGLGQLLQSLVPVGVLGKRSTAVQLAQRLLGTEL